VLGVYKRTIARAQDDRNVRTDLPLEIAAISVLFNRFVMLSCASDKASTFLWSSVFTVWSSSLRDCISSLAVSSSSDVVRCKDHHIPNFFGDTIAMSPFAKEPRQTIGPDVDDNPFRIEARTGGFNDLRVQICRKYLDLAPLRRAFEAFVEAVRCPRAFMA